MHFCAEFNNIEIFRWYQDRWLGDINSVNIAGETPLIVAAREGRK